MFARHAVVAPYNGVLTLHLRLGNERASQILSAEVSAVLLRLERTAEGAEFRRFYDLPLARSRTPIFALTFTVMHPITEESPFWGVTEDAMRKQDAELLITVTGLEETTSQTVHARYSYRVDEILWGHQFVDIFERDASGRRFIDYSRFHATERART
jgi:inward rectifier potassium channel